MANVLPLGHGKVLIGMGFGAAQRERSSEGFRLEMDSMQKVILTDGVEAENKTTSCGLLVSCEASPNFRSAQSADNRR